MKGEKFDSEAISEVAKASEKAIDAVSSLGRFFEKVMGELVIDAAGLLADRLKFYRLERAELLAERTQARIEERKIAKFRSVPPKIALPIIERATIEDNDELHNLWAGLLATAMDANAPLVRNKYVALLGQLDIEDVRLIRELGAHYSSDEKGMSVETLQQLGFRAATIQYLYSVGLVTILRIEQDKDGLLYNTGLRAAIRHHNIRISNIFTRGWVGVRDNQKDGGRLDLVVLSVFGRDFLNAVTPSTKSIFEEIYRDHTI